MVDIFSNVGDRIQLLLDHLQLKKVQLARATGISPNAISNYINNKRVPDTEAVYKISKALGTSMEWILTGEGKMLLSEVPTNLTESMVWSTDVLTKQQLQLLYLFDQTNETVKDSILDYLTYTVGKQHADKQNLSDSRQLGERHKTGDETA